jgi:hypothetical protein
MKSPIISLGSFHFNGVIPCLPCTFFQYTGVEEKESCPLIYTNIHESPFGLIAQRKDQLAAGDEIHSSNYTFWVKHEMSTSNIGRR